MVLSIMVPHIPALGSGGVPPVPPTILMSEMGKFGEINSADTRAGKFLLVPMGG